jgi:twitching motility protein PilT
LLPLDQPALRQEELRRLVEVLLPPVQLREFAESREADFAASLSGVGRFRINAYQQRGTVAFAIRAIPQAVATVRELNLPPVLE